MKVYVLISRTHVVHGHGDSGYEPVLCTIGSYGQHGFAPAFLDENTAKEYAKEHTELWNPIIIELNVKEKS